MIWVIIHLELVMVKLVWVLGTLTFPPINMIFQLVVEIFCHLGICIIHPSIIKTKIGSLIHFLRGGTIILVFLVMVEVVLVL